MSGQGGSKQLNMFDALTMDTPCQQVLTVVSRRIGRNQAISVEEVTLITGIPGRTVRNIVKHLIEHHMVRIGSALGRPSGYFMIANKEEAEANEKTLRHLALSTLRHAAVIKQLAIKDYLSQIQGELL